MTWSGRKVERARAMLAARTEWPASCARCTKPVQRNSRWVCGHKISRALRPDLEDEPSNWQVEHRACSDRSAQTAVIEKARAEGAKQVYNGAFPHTGPSGQPPPLPVSLSAPLSAALGVPDDLRWASHALDAPTWLTPYLNVPEDVATAPRAMTPTHPEATGSYGPALIEWARETQGVEVRWWQGLSLCRILEHREDGSLCWEEVIISCSRRSGKSVVVRLLALWRMVFAPALFGEMQLVVHSASTLRVAKEPMRYASPWARRQDRFKVSTNNNNYSIEDVFDGHRWIVLPLDASAGLDTNLAVIDEAWAASPEKVDDDLEPSLMERVSPQLLLVSTAHRRASSLMRTRISGALAGEGQGRTLLLLWAADPEADPASAATWKSASPHWSPEREAYVARKYEKAARGEQDIEFDDPDPMSGFVHQYLNQWRLRERVRKGNQITTEEGWAALEVEPPFDRPDAVAIESRDGEGVSVAFAWGIGDWSVVSADDHPDLASAAVAVKESGFRGMATVGASLYKDPALRGIRQREGKGRAVAAVQELARLLAEDVVRHDGGPHLTGQVLDARTMPTPDGHRMASSARADAIKASAWAIERSRKARSSVLVVTARETA